MDERDRVISAILVDCINRISVMSADDSASYFVFLNILLRLHGLKALCWGNPTLAAQWRDTLTFTLQCGVSIAENIRY